MIQEAEFYKLQDDDVAFCELCPHHCQLKSGQTGICQVRRNDKGTLYTLNYANVSALALDPIEKKPLYHFFPGKNILSAGTYGCNLSCNFCQNYGIAQEIGVGRRILPKEMVEITMQTQVENSIGLAFTYNEPSIWYEYIRETAELLQEADLKVALVSNGYIERKPMDELLPYIDALNIDLKAFTKEFYKKNCKAKLDPVKNTIEKAADKVHLEITTLIITEENDSPAELKELVKYIAEINPNIPLHLSRYRPQYKMTNPATPIKTMEIAYEIAKEHLNFVYVGNMGWGNNTFCIDCGTTLIKRNVYQTTLEALEKGKCKNCQAIIDYIQF